MDAEELRALQAPLKAKYKADAPSAVVTMRASVTVADDAAAARLAPRHSTFAGLHPAAGGTGAELCSGDMLLEALAACAGVTLKAVATAMGITLQAAAVTAEATCDFRGTLGLDKAVPVGLSDVRLTFYIEAAAPKDQVAKLVELTERYCVVYQTFRNPPRLDVAVVSAT